MTRTPLSTPGVLNAAPTGSSSWGKALHEIQQTRAHAHRRAVRGHRDGTGRGPRRRTGRSREREHERKHEGKHGPRLERACEPGAEPTAHRGDVADRRPRPDPARRGRADPRIADAALAALRPTGRVPEHGDPHLGGSEAGALGAQPLRHLGLRRRRAGSRRPRATEGHLREGCRTASPARPAGADLDRPQRHQGAHHGHRVVRRAPAAARLARHVSAWRLTHLAGPGCAAGRPGVPAPHADDQRDDPEGQADPRRGRLRLQRR